METTITHTTACDKAHDKVEKAYHALIEISGSRLRDTEAHDIAIEAHKKAKDIYNAAHADCKDGNKG